MNMFTVAGKLAGQLQKSTGQSEADLKKRALMLTLAYDTAACATLLLKEQQKAFREEVTRAGYTTILDVVDGDVL